MKDDMKDDLDSAWTSLNIAAQNVSEAAPDDDDDDDEIANQLNEIEAAIHDAIDLLDAFGEDRYGNDW